MSNMETIIKLFVMLSLVLAVVTTPFFSKKDIHFGVRMPNIDSEQLRRIRIRFMTLNIVFAMIASGMMLKVQDPVWGILGVTFGYLAIAGLIYILAYKDVKALKKESIGQTGQGKKRQLIVVDTNFTKEKGKKMMVSPWYFLIPVVIVLIIAVVTIINYDLISDPMPLHYNAAGEVDGWTDKTYLSALMLPLVSLAMTGIFYFIYLIIGKSKQQLSTNSPHLSSLQNRKYRKIWSGYIIASATLMNMLFAYLQLMMLRRPAEKAGEMMFVTLGFTLIMVVSSLAIGVYAGNGGSKLKVVGQSVENDEEEQSDDDQHWKWGVIYYNPNDPSVFVEKRVGIGWTVNVGTIQGKLLLVGTFVFTIAVVVMGILSNK